MNDSPTLDEGVPLEQIEDSISIDADCDLVYQHMAHVEGLSITEAVTTDWRGGRALVLVTPDPDGTSTVVSMMADAPEGSEAATEMRVRMRHELERVAATLEGRASGTGDQAFARIGDRDHVETGLDAIEEDQAEGVREAPFADDPTHRP
ncbi:MAG TPA: hypothetical protein VNC60_02600 [Actinomycetota bacterium]|nr:hypothetical protein [Actinomycetota bacterium]